LTGRAGGVLVLFMQGVAARSLTDRFAWLFDGLCKAIGVNAHRRGMEAALAWVVWHRVRVLGERLIALAARVQAGRLPRRRTATPHPGFGPLHGPKPQGEREKSAEVAASGVRLALPRGFGWIRKMLPEAAQFAGVIQYMLRDPEVAGLVEKSPQARRILRRLCNLLGVNAPEFLRRGSGKAENIPATAQPVNDPTGAIAQRVGAVAIPPPEPAVPGPTATAAIEGARDEAGAAEGRESPSAPPVDANVGAPPAADWLRQDAEAMRERVARWVARHADAPSTLLPLGLSTAVEFPGTRPLRRFSKLRD